MLPDEAAVLPVWGGPLDDADEDKHLTTEKLAKSLSIDLD